MKSVSAVRMCTWMVNKSLSLHWSCFSCPDGQKKKQHGVGVSLNPSHLNADAVYCSFIWTTWLSGSICSVKRSIMRRSVGSSQWWRCLLRTVRTLQHSFEKLNWTLTSQRFVLLEVPWKCRDLHLVWVAHSSRHFVPSSLALEQTASSLHDVITA